MTKSVMDLEINEETGVAVLYFNQIVIDTPFVRTFHQKLDILDKREGAQALVTTCRNKKSYSAGLKFSIFTRHYDDIHNFIAEYCRLLGRLLRLSYPTVAAINGHCMAGGYMLAMAHDIRICVANPKSKLGMTEINIGLNIPVNMLAPLKAKMSKRALRDICLFGKIVNPEKAFKMNLIDTLQPKENLLQFALTSAKKLVFLGTNRVAYGGIKLNLYKDYIREAEEGYPDKNSKQLMELSKINI